MSDQLSTADLAGGSATRSRPMDTSTTARDPMTDNRDDDYQTDGSDRTDTMGHDPSMTTAPRRTSELRNPAATDGADVSDNRAEPLFPTGEAEGFRSRWGDVQTGFVDEPRSAVEQADGLVAEMMKRLAQVFADERSKLEEQWSRGDDISTEDLRQSLRRYRSFMDRLLSV
jgi:hypothetical protein